MVATARALREEQLDLLEATRPVFLAEARETARRLALQGDRTLTVDELREAIDVPPHIDPRVMGAVFRGEEWEPLGFENSRRRTCHGRPIRRFLLRR